MNQTFFWLLASLLGVLPGATNHLRGAETAELESAGCPVRLTLNLKDGSRIEGEPVQVAWPLRTELAGAVKMKLSLIASVEMTPDQGAKVTFKNGDQLTARLELPGIALKTTFGKVNVALDLIRAIRVSPAGGARHALEFNLRNRVEIPNDPRLQFGRSPFTISCWLRTESDRPLISLISKRTNPLGDGWVLHQDHGQLLFYCAGCCSPKSEPVNIRDGQWHHLAVRRDGNLISFHLDGKNVGSGETRCDHDDHNPIRIGMDGDGDAWHFEGELSEVHFYGRALSPAEIAEEWNNGADHSGPVAAGGLIAGYHFDEGEGDSAKDFSGNNHTGRLINSPVWGKR